MYIYIYIHSSLVDPPPLCLANPAYCHVFTKNGFPDFHFMSAIRQG